MLNFQIEKGRMLIDVSDIEEVDIPHAAEALMVICKSRSPHRLRSSRQMRHDDGFPHHPNDNPSVEEGIYDATVQGACWRPYADGQCMQIRLELEHGLRMVSNLYYRRDSKPDSVDRILRYLCDAAGKSPQAVKSTPSLLTGARLRVEVTEAEDGYSCIDRFFPR